MSDALTLLLLHVAAALGLLGAGGLALWLLPWSDAEVAHTARGFAALAARLQGAERPRMPVAASR